jgi:hypothetical protein
MIKQTELRLSTKPTLVVEKNYARDRKIYAEIEIEKIYVWRFCARVQKALPYSGQCDYSYF